MIAAAVLGLALRSASLSAQQVPYTAPGTTSLTGVPMIYNGQYAIQKTDFGFLWLDTAALQPGMVQVESKCGVGQYVAATGLYVLGDCNGISNVSSSGDIVMARQYSGQCGAATDGCGGSRDPDGGTGMFAFRLGTWEYLGRDLPDIVDSTQTADLLGRTWTVQAQDGNGKHYLWVSNGNPNAPPLANATATNLSAAGRADKTNYYGDKWQLQDASVSTLPISRIDWDFLYKTFFSPNEVGAPASEGTVVGYFPCDPNGTTTGNFRSGANCLQSLGLTNPAAPNSYRFAMQSANANGTSVTPFISAPIPAVCPQANILGYAGFSGTCAKTSGTLGILSGGNADASASQGNLGEASVNWSFSGQHPIIVQGAIVPVPSGATGFTLTITYPGGYAATAQGSIVQASLIPAFSVVPDPVLVNTSLTLTNQMQMSGATLNSVNYVVSPGACSSSFNAFGSAPQVPSAFLATGGAAVLQAPSAVGGYCVNLKYNFTPQGQLQQSLVVSNPFSAMNWSASPLIGISPVPFCTSSCQLQAGTAYTLWDTENISVSPHPGSQWDLNGTPIGTSSDANAPISWTPNSACSSCTLRVTVNGSSAILPVSISGLAPPTPTPTPTATPTPTNTPNATATPTPPPPPPPNVTTDTASGVAQSSATFTATVNPNGAPTSVSFEYGTTTSYGDTTAQQPIGSGTTALSVRQAVAGLNCGTTYHFRAVATTSYSTMKGLDQTMTTMACSPASFYTVTPCRLVDTRNPDGPSGGPALSAGDVRSFPAAGTCGIPSTARAIVSNIAVYLPTATGDLRAFPAGGATPMASAINFRAGIVRANSAIIPLGTGGQVAIQCDMSSGSTNMFIDVFGYFQ